MVPEVFLYGLDIIPVLQGCNGKAVAQIMKPQIRQSDALSNAFEVSPHCRLRDGSTSVTGENQPRYWFSPIPSGSHPI